MFFCARLYSDNHRRTRDAKTLHVAESSLRYWPQSPEPLTTLTSGYPRSISTSVVVAQLLRARCRLAPAPSRGDLHLTQDCLFGSCFSSSRVSPGDLRRRQPPCSSVRNRLTRMIASDSNRSLEKFEPVSA